MRAAPEPAGGPGKRGCALRRNRRLFAPYNDHDGTGHELAAVNAGLMAAEALRATVNSAKLSRRLCGWGMPGKRADFALFAENPLRISQLQPGCAAVIQNGKFAKTLPLGE